mmetsp:Transcript_4023/g.3362  ORF Transcript_4023/g.3362 Transcript_4023/m.3362 type:complete len:169 (-) Transcript_4023:98-604(-)
MNYEALNGGRPEHAMKLFTKNSEYLRMSHDPSNSISLKNIFSRLTFNALFWRYIRNLLDNNYIIVASSKTNLNNDIDSSIVYEHAYSILDAEEIDNNKLFQLRNPHGMGEWEGKWGDYDQVNMTDRVRSRLKEKQQKRGKNSYSDDADDGVFWIAEATFISYFANVSY